MKGENKALLKARRELQLFRNRPTGANRWPSASLTHRRSWGIVFCGEAFQRRPQPRLPPVPAAEPAALRALPPPQSALPLLLPPHEPRARESIREPVPVCGPTCVPSADLAWSFSFDCPSVPSQLPGQWWPVPRDDDACLHPGLAPGRSLVPLGTYLLRARPGGLELRQCWSSPSIAS